jgi:hypothetical protein
MLRAQVPLPTGGIPGEPRSSGWLVVPLGVVTVAEVVVVFPGHHARNHPLVVVACTGDPSLRSRVKAVTPVAAFPSTSV